MTRTIEKGTAGEPETINAQVSCLPLPTHVCPHASRLGRNPVGFLGCEVGQQVRLFRGDTGYRAVPYVPPSIDDYGPQFASLPVCPQFKQIGEHRGPFDPGLIPIGAYYPRIAFSPVHANPFASVEIFQDTKCERAMSIHWGTWALTMEEVLEPPKLLQLAMKRKGLLETGIFDVCNIGESREF